MKRIVTILTLAAAMTVSAVAQPGPPPPGGPRHDRLADLLQLTADQKAAWASARKDFETATQPLREKEQATHEQLETALDAASPDPTAIGNLMLSIKAIHDQIRTAHEALDQKLASVLTPDQKAKFDAFLAARKAEGPHGPGPRH
jgi:Spy/CpxP family protein refolding chaperone